MRQGDLVVRRSYGGDIVFRIEALTPTHALLRGTDYRLLADAPYEDLLGADEAFRIERRVELDQRVSKAVQGLVEQRGSIAGKGRAAQGGKSRVASGYFELPGKVLHLDGDPGYLRKSMALYGQLRIPADGYYVPEDRMADALRELLPYAKPDIVVLTGHDGLLKNQKDGDALNLANYKNSINFVKAVQAARQFERHKDALVVVAGACQSHFEALVQAGANFASSPARVLIHALDPLYIAARVAFTPIGLTVQTADVLHHTLSGLEGLGGIETRGCYRLGLPRTALPQPKN